MNITRMHKQLAQSAELKAVEESLKADRLRAMAKSATGKRLVALRSAIREAELFERKLQAEALRHKQELARLEARYPGQGDIYSQGNTYVRSEAGLAEVEHFMGSASFTITAGQRGW